MGSGLSRTSLAMASFWMRAVCEANLRRDVLDQRLRRHCEHLPVEAEAFHVGEPARHIPATAGNLR